MMTSIIFSPKFTIISILDECFVNRIYCSNSESVDKETVWRRGYSKKKNVINLDQLTFLRFGKRTAVGSPHVEDVRSYIYSSMLVEVVVSRFSA